jgi:16S rRNA G966 N2-methylase RsmD
MVDLTGGYGVDTYFLSERFAHTDYVEQNEELCKIAEHNFNVRSDNVRCTKVSIQHNFNVRSDNVRCTKVSIHNSTAEEFLKTAGEYDLIFLDPARRDSHGGKVFRLEDCTPNVVELLPTLLRHGKQIMLKLSPMLDLTQAINKLQSDKGTKYQVTKDQVQSDKGTKYQVTKWDCHIVAIKNEVKELLLLSGGTGQITAIDLEKKEQAFCFTREEEQNCQIVHGKCENGKWLYEPSAAILKAGAYKLVGARYGLQKLDVNTHLYTSERLVTDFPGRKWKIEQVVRDRKDLPAELKQANVLTRNYPMTPEQLKKKLHLRDGGTAYLIGARIQGKPTVIRATLIP